MSYVEGCRNWGLRHSFVLSDSGRQPKDTVCTNVTNECSLAGERKLGVPPFPPDEHRDEVGGNLH